ncbi:hypothetical protein CCS01_11245 [Rhodopila globiformis]|uniref:HicB-like antitoxin of toxin-antitoxin system domain-containing protein n=2 Tax=Rhodopila globiformis TaxID=1071 RepID=A0A2S6NIA2_RHOGL|nr:hypothetical protein CCS01_11245 [Rhodopila globiformis]
MALPEDEGGGYLAVAPDLLGCMADGATEEAAIADIRSAIGEWIDEAKRLGREVPEPNCINALYANGKRKLILKLRPKIS